jgi:hypothetical protein
LDGREDVAAATAVLEAAARSSRLTRARGSLAASESTSSVRLARDQRAGSRIAFRPGWAWNGLRKHRDAQVVVAATIVATLEAVVSHNDEALDQAESTPFGWRWSACKITRSDDRPSRSTAAFTHGQRSVSCDGEDVWTALADPAL